jgi:hypothetical protein
MTSKEYAMYQQKYVGIGPIYAAKTAALFKQEIEDFVVKGERALSFALCRDGTTLIFPRQSCY